MSSSDDKRHAIQATPPPIVVDPDPRERLGEVIDNRYRVLEFIGQGGMGNVYKAEHVTIRRPVALKLLHATLATLDPIRKRFEREAFAIGRIDHPNCVNVSDFGKLDDGSLYLVMEFLEGESLGDLLDRERRIEPRRALHITRHVLRGLGHAHRAGIVHRDVKPENVFLVRMEPDPDFAKILDFGIAKLVGGSEPEISDKLTQAGVAFGTPIYLSPEQAVGDPADPRSDLYSATVMLFEMLAGAPPFSSEDKLQILAMHTTRPPPRLDDMAPMVQFPPGTEELVQFGLIKSPAQRFQSAEEYIEAIDRIVEPFSENTPAPMFRPTTHSDPLGWFTRTPATPTPLPKTPAPLGPDDTNAIAIAPRESEMRATSAPRPPTAPFGSRYTPMPQGHDPMTATPVPLSAPPPGGTMTLRLVPRGKVALAAVAAGLALIVVLLFSFGGEDTPVTTDTRKVDSEAKAEREVRKAEEVLAQGDPAQSILKLEAQDGIENNPEGQLQLGHAYATQSEYDKALKAYARAATLDSRLARDATMQTNLRLMTDSDGVVYVEAARLLLEYTGDSDARKVLTELASSKGRDQRRAAFALLERLGMDDGIDRAKAFSWELKQGETCELRKEAVAKLRALGDKRAIPHLQLALGKKLQRVNRCMLQPAEDAIRYLESLPPDAQNPD